MKCANVAFSVVPRISAGDAENWKILSSIWFSVLAYVWHCMLFVCCCFFFFFLFCLLLFFHSDLPSTHYTTC